MDELWLHHQLPVPDGQAGEQRIGLPAALERLPDPRFDIRLLGTREERDQNRLPTISDVRKRGVDQHLVSELLLNEGMGQREQQVFGSDAALVAFDDAQGQEFSGENHLAVMGRDDSHGSNPVGAAANEQNVFALRALVDRLLRRGDRLAFAGGMLGEAFAPAIHRTDVQLLDHCRIEGFGHAGHRILVE